MRYRPRFVASSSEWSAGLTANPVMYGGRLPSTSRVLGAVNGTVEALFVRAERPQPASIATATVKHAL